MKKHNGQPGSNEIDEGARSCMRTQNVTGHSHESMVI